MPARPNIDDHLWALIQGRGAPASVRTLIGMRDAGNRLWLTQTARGLADYVVGLEYRPHAKRRSAGAFVVRVRHGGEVLTIHAPGAALIRAAAAGKGTRPRISESEYED